MPVPMYNKHLARDSSTVVETLSRHIKVKGSIIATASGTGREKMIKRLIGFSGPYIEQRLYF